MHLTADQDPRPAAKRGRKRGTTRKQRGKKLQRSRSGTVSAAAGYSTLQTAAGAAAQQTEACDVPREVAGCTTADTAAAACDTLQTAADTAAEQTEACGAPPEAPGCAAADAATNSGGMRDPPKRARKERKRQAEVVAEETCGARGTGDSCAAASLAPRRNKRRRTTRQQAFGALQSASGASNACKVCPQCSIWHDFIQSYPSGISCGHQLGWRWLLAGATIQTEQLKADAADVEQIRTAHPGRQRAFGTEQHAQHPCGPGSQPLTEVAADCHEQEQGGAALRTADAPGGSLPQQENKPPAADAKSPVREAPKRERRYARILC